MKNFLRDRAGSVQIEYVLVGSLIALALIGAITRIGTKVNGVFVSTATALAP